MYRDRRPEIAELFRSVESYSDYRVVSKKVNKSSIVDNLTENEQ